MTSKRYPLFLPLALPAAFLAKAGAATNVTAAVNNGDWMAAATWSDNAVPVPENSYFVPNAIAIDGYTGASTNSAVTRTFAGGSLTIQNGGSLYLDSLHGASYPDWTYTIPNLTLENGASLHVRGGNGTDFFLTNGFTVAADSTVAIRHSAGSYAQQFRLGAITGPATSTVQILATHNPSNGGVNSKDNYATVANSSYAGNWLIDYTVAAAGKTVRLRADAANALGTGAVTIARQATLENNATGGLNSLTGITLQQATSTANLGSGWSSPTGVLTLDAGNLILGSGFSTASFATFNHTGGILQLDLGATPASSDKVVLSGNYTTINGPIDLYLKSDPGTSTYDLITYGGSLSGTPSVLVATSTPTRLVPTVTNGDGSNDKVSVSFSGTTANLVWKGNDATNPNNWDLNVTSNFDNASLADKFLVADAVTFDDTAASFTPALVGSVAPRAVTFSNATNAYTLGGTGAIAGSASLVKSGAANLTITAANSYTGGTTLNAGKIRIGNNAALGSGTLTVTNGVISADGTTARTLATPLVLNGTLAVGDATDTATVTFSGGATLTGNSTIEILNGVVGNALNGVITDGAGSFALTKQGAGNIGFNSANTYDGGTLISAGRITASNTAALGTGPVIIATDGQAYYSTAGTIANEFTITGNGITEGSGQLGAIRLGAGNNASGSITLAGDARITAYNSNGSISGNIGQSGGARKLELGGTGLGATGGTLTVSGTNSHSGGTDVRNATVVANSSTAFGTGAVVLNGAERNARIQLGNGVTVTNALTSQANVGATGRGVLEVTGTNSATWSGPITLTAGVGGGGHLYTDSGATLSLLGGITSAASEIVQRAGNIVIAGGGSYPAYQVTGNLKLGGTNGVATNANLKLGVSGVATFDLNGFNQTVAQLTRTANTNSVFNNGATASVLTIDNTVDHSLASTTISDGTGGLSLVKKGSGSFTLTAASTYTGATSVEGGKLVLNATTAATPITVAAGGTLGGTGGGSGSGINGSIAVAGTLAPGAVVGEMYTNSVVTFGPGSTYAWEIGDWNGTAAGTDWDLVNSLDLALTATPANKLKIAISGSPANFSETAKTFEIARSSTPITGFNASAIQIDTTGFYGTGTWSVQLNGNSIELVYAAGTGDAFTTWSASYGLPANPAVDSDGDGIANGIEFVIGGKPNAGTGSNSNGLLPTITTDAQYLNFTYRRTDEAAGMPPAKQPYVQYGSDLNGWEPAVAGEDGVTVSEVNGTPDLVTVKIPRSLAGNGKLFARLRVDLE
jgi:fibronectin-binding autotransporter adhesin